LTMGSRDVLTEILRQGAQRMLKEAIEAEVSDYLARHAPAVDAQGRRLVVRNGVRPGRKVQTGVGLIEIDLPRVNDQRLDASPFSHGRFPLSGLTKTKSYQFEDADTQTSFTINANELASDGIAIEIDQPHQSRLLYYRAR